MPITAKLLLRIPPSAGKQAGVFASALNLAMDRYQIHTRLTGLLNESDTARFKAHAAYKLALDKINMQKWYPSSIDWPVVPNE